MSELVCLLLCFSFCLRPSVGFRNELKMSVSHPEKCKQEPSHLCLIFFSVCGPEDRLFLPIWLYVLWGRDLFKKLTMHLITDCSFPSHCVRWSIVMYWLVGRQLERCLEQMFRKEERAKRTFFCMSYSVFDACESILQIKMLSYTYMIWKDQNHPWSESPWQCYLMKFPTSW